MRRKVSKPELEWRTATIEQVADLRLWVAARVPTRHAQAICEWLFMLTDPKAPKVSKRHLELYRRLLRRYGPPRRTAAALNVEQTRSEVRHRLAEMADRPRTAGIRPVDDPPQAVVPLHPRPVLGDTSDADHDIDSSDASAHRFDQA
ncbi:MAG TPA: hypothetical protein VFF40_07260 [Acidimicrobiia bacterium]|nr:hypothetical protein [Acidimicrobiia bacterium]